jgi:hypothetical protein
MGRRRSEMTTGFHSDDPELDLFIDFELELELED